MKNIYKYTIMPTNKQDLVIPSDKILSANEQRGDIVVYAIRDERLEPINYTFRIIGTGHPIDYDISEYTFLNTVKMHNGSLMFHVFYKKSS